MPEKKLEGLPEKPVLNVGDEEVEIKKIEIKEALLRLYEKFNLSGEEKEKIEQFLTEQLKKVLDRKKITQEKGLNFDKSNYLSALNRVFTKLEFKLEQNEYDKKRNRERINPQLLSKFNIEKVYNETVDNSKENNSEEMIVFVNIDLDEFKIINDKYGHVEGDNVLKSFGQALNNSIRPDDFGAHFSGDEFGFMFTIKTNNQEDINEQIEKVIKRICEQAQKETTRPDERTQELSIGYTVINKNNPSDFETTQQNADQGIELSKLLKSFDKKSSERIINGDEAKKLLEKYTAQYGKEEIELAQTVRSMKRPLQEVNPQATAKQIAKAVKAAIEIIKGA